MQSVPFQHRPDGACSRVGSDQYLSVCLAEETRAMASNRLARVSMVLWFLIHHVPCMLQINIQTCKELWPYDNPTQLSLPVTDD